VLVVLRFRLLYLFRLVKGDLRGIDRSRQLRQATMGNIRQNLFFAFIYNALGVPVAAGVLYPFFDSLLSPMPCGGRDEFFFAFSHHERTAVAKIITIKLDGLDDFGSKTMTRAPSKASSGLGYFP